MSGRGALRRSMALPIIATHWSGPEEFLDETNGYPLPIDGLDTVADGAFAGHQWARPDRAALQRLMRHVVTHPDEARAKGQRARAAMVARFAPAVLTEQLATHLRRIQAGLARRALARATARQQHEAPTADDGADGVGGPDSASPAQLVEAAMHRLQARERGGDRDL